MTVSEIEISRQIVAATRRADDLGLVMNAQGNFSVRIPGSECFIITPHGVPYARITPEDMVTCDLAGTKLHGEHDSSSEADVHALAYRRYHEVGACVHVEPTYINVLYAMNLSVPNILGNFVYLFGGRGLASGPSLRSGTSGFAAASLDAMGDHFGVVWKNHGSSAWAPTSRLPSTAASRPNRRRGSTTWPLPSRPGNRTSFPWTSSPRWWKWRGRAVGAKLSS